MVVPVDVVDSSFDAQVLKCDIPVLANFGVAWSAPCRKLAPHIAELAEENEGRMKVVNLDLETNPTIASNYSILRMPTLILFKFGQPVARITGPVEKTEILSQIEPHLDVQA